jgi:hypothetical protein
MSMSPPHVTFIHNDFWTVAYTVYLLGINAVVAFQAGQLTDPEYRAIPSLVAVAAVAMARGIPVIPQFHPHEEVSHQDNSPVFLFYSVYTVFAGFFRVSDSVWRIRIRDPGSGAFSTHGFEMGKVRIRDPGWKKFGSGINTRIRNNIPGSQHWLILMPPHHCCSAKSFCVRSY